MGQSEECAHHQARFGHPVIEEVKRPHLLSYIYQTSFSISDCLQMGQFSTNAVF